MVRTNHSAHGLKGADDRRNERSVHARGGVTPNDPALLETIGLPWDPARPATLGIPQSLGHSWRPMSCCKPGARRPKEPAAGVPVDRSIIGLHQRHRRWRCDPTRVRPFMNASDQAAAMARRARDAGDGESSLRGVTRRDIQRAGAVAPAGRAPGSSACAEDSRTEQRAIPSATRRVAQRDIVRNMRSTAARKSGDDHFVADSIVQLPSPHEVTTDDAEPLEG